MPENKKSSRARVAILLVSLFVVMLILLAHPPQSELEALPAQPHNSQGLAGSGLANCRYGATANRKQISYGLIDNIGAGVFYKFNDPYWVGDLPDNNAERLLMIKIKQKKTSDGQYLPEYKSPVRFDQELVDYIRANSGAVWILGNEVERGPNPGETGTGQGDIFPEVYAEAYHDIYHFIKGVDPAARVAIAGLIQATPNRLQYLDILWDAYQEKYGVPMPVDVWNIHLYVLPEVTPEGEPNGIANVALGTDKSLAKRESGRDIALCPDPDVYCYAEHDDVDIIAEQLFAMRRWMKDHGQQDKPLIVSEYSTLYHLKFNEDGSCKGIKDENGDCFLPERVSKYLTDTFDLFNNTRDLNLGQPMDDYRLVQQWIWFNGGWDYSTSPLMEPESPLLSAIGETFRGYVHAEPIAVNLLVEDVSAVASQNADGTYDAELSVIFRNNGNVAVNEPFLVSFYRDEGLTQQIGSAAVSDLVRGCATGSYSAAVPWTSLPEGTYRFWVKLDSTNAVYELFGDGDNTGTAELFADPSAPIYSLDVQVGGPDTGQGGVIQIDPDAARYARNEQVALTAVPLVGWAFESWTGDASGVDATLTLTMDGHKTIQANFRREQYQINAVVSGDGSVLAVPNKETYTYGESVTLNAIPAYGWRFGSWGGAVEGELPAVDVELLDHINVTANFVQILPGVVDQAYLPFHVRP